MNILVTGVAGFIGFHVARCCIQRGISVVGIDNLNDYYDPQLKKDRLAELAPFREFTFHHRDIDDDRGIDTLFMDGKFTHVIHLAAQAGVRYSINNPRSYIQSNIVGFLNILEGCRHTRVQHLVYASSSSIYGLNTDMPYSTRNTTDHPASLYAATKKSNEVMAHSYSHLYGLPTTGLRFFTVYGPWGRPDMAMSIFTKAILADKPIPLFNDGKMQRDFTYIDDIVEGVIRVCGAPPQADPAWNRLTPTPDSSSAPFALYNIGNNNPVPLMDMVHELERALGKKARIESLPMQPGDVPATYADIDPLVQLTGFHPSTSLANGVDSFVQWYTRYHSVS